MHETLQHCLQEHPEKEVSMLKPEKVQGKIKHRAVHFKLSKEELLMSPSKLTTDSDRLIIYVPDEGSLLSPAQKVQKNNATTEGKAQKILFPDNTKSSSEDKYV